VTFTPPWLAGVLVLAAMPALAQTAPAPAPASAPAAPAGDQGPIDVLVRQAEHWLAVGRVDLAQAASDRALAAAPDNPRALAIAARLAAARGDQSAANALITRLRSAGGTAAERSSAEQAVTDATLDSSALDQARQLARSGHLDEAALRYRTVFPNGPTDRYALEFYQTLASTQSGRAAGLQGLARLAAAPGADDQVLLAQAQALTYAPDTRAEGIKALAALAARPTSAAAALRAWHDALGYYGTDPAVAPLIEAYLQRDPSDAALRQRLVALQASAAVQAATVRPDPGDALRREGFADLDRNALDASAEQFKAAIAANPNDGDALGGLGIVRLRQNKPDEARPLLERAVAADPAHAAQWQKALDGAAYGEELTQANTLLRQGDTSAALVVLQRAATRDVDDKADVQTLLGQLLLKQSDSMGAAEQFRAALASRPAFAPAVRGLAVALHGGQPPVAVTAAPAERPAGPSANPPPVAQSAGGPGGALRDEAARSTDTVVAVALLRNAMAMAPDDPWTRLDLARVLQRQGLTAEARALVEDLAASAGTPDANYAAALLAQEGGRVADADAFLARIPSGQRSPDMVRLAVRIRTTREISAAAMQLSTSNPESRMPLLQIAARPDPSGTTAAAVVAAFGLAGDQQGAIEAARAGQAANRLAGAGARIAIAGALLGAGADAEAQGIADPLRADPRLTGQQRTDLANLSTGIAIRASDRLNEAGDQAQAFERLRPALAADPQGVDAQLALARLYQTAKRPAEAQKIAEAVLARDPRNFDARRGAVEAAIAAGDLPHARALISDARLSTPDDSRVLQLQAQVAQAAGNDDQARALLQRATELRRIELAATGNVSGTTLTAPDAGLRNPFADAGTVAATAAASTDAQTRDIATALAQAQETTASTASAGIGLRTRTGTAGLDKLTELSAPMDASISAGSLGGRFTASVTPELIDSGQISSGDTASLLRFGSNAANNTTANSGQGSIAGLGLGVKYDRDDVLKVDVGTSPLGFRTTNILGGLEFAPQLTSNLKLRITADRRSVTDSELSWSGERDPVSGTVWGGVVRSGGRAQLETPLGPGYAYLGAGYHTFTGIHVESNSSVEGGAGASYPVLHGPDGTLSTGVDLVYLAYANNQRGFTVGQGGYFSPQSYTAVNVPIDYRGKIGDFDYHVGVTAGYARFNEANSPLFPLDPQLQSAAEAAAALNPDVPTTNQGQNQSGFIGSVRLGLDYAITSNVMLSSDFSFDKAAEWQETRFIIKLRDRF